MERGLFKLKGSVSSLSLIYLLFVVSLSLFSTLSLASPSTQIPSSTPLSLPSRNVSRSGEMRAGPINGKTYTIVRAEFDLYDFFVPHPSVGSKLSDAQIQQVHDTIAADMERLFMVNSSLILTLSPIEFRQLSVYEVSFFSLQYDEQLAIRIKESYDAWRRYGPKSSILAQGYITRYIAIDDALRVLTLSVHECGKKFQTSLCEVSSPEADISRYVLYGFAGLLFILMAFAFIKWKCGSFGNKQSIQL